MRSFTEPYLFNICLQRRCATRTRADCVRTLGYFDVRLRYFVLEGCH
jgi:hypothetical protein